MYRFTFVVFGGAILLAFILPSAAVLAAWVTHESFVSTDPQKSEILGFTTGAQLGATMTIGDFDGNGRQELVASAPFASTALSEWAGQVVIFDQFNEVKLIIWGESSGDQLGTSLTSGDYDDDGLDDLAIGAFNAYDDGNRPGKVYVLYGRTLANKQVIDLSDENAGAVLVGPSDGSQFGLSLANGDINNDGIDDLVIGAPAAKNLLENNSGMVYAVYGRKGGFARRQIFTKEGMADLKINGQQADEKFGSSIAIGDVSNDKKADILIGAPGYNTEINKEVGRVYIFTKTSSISNTLKTSTATIDGSGERGWFGFDIQTGDFNKDKAMDFLISSFPYGTRSNTGEISAFYGAGKFSHEGAAYKAVEVRDFVIDQPSGQAFLGARLLLADFNEDDKDDIIAGAPGIGFPQSREAGDVYIVYSNSAGFEKQYSVKNKLLTSIIHGENADDWFGYSLAAADFNGDGRTDLAIGSRYSSVENGVNNGKIFILHGTLEPFGEAKEVQNPEDNYISRGEVIRKTLDKLKLKTAKEDFLNSCKKYPQYCLFNFVAVSTYENLDLGPRMILYPDVQPHNKYYEDINVATMLGIVNGYTGEQGTPFRPEDSVTRIQALKIVLTAAELVPYKYRFELISILGSYQNLVNQKSFFDDVDPRISYMWWYPRYVNFAVEKGIVDDGKYFRPDDYITMGEFEDLLTRTVSYLNEKNGKAEL